MDHGYSHRCCIFTKERKMHKQIQCIEDGQKQHRTNHIEHQMDRCRTFCIFLCSDGRQHGSHTGTDILSHDNRKCCAIRNCSSHTQCLQDTNRSTGALDHRSQHGTCKNSQHWVGENQKNVGKFRYVCQRFYCAGHGFHTIHQNSKANQDISDILFLLPFGKHDHCHADHTQYRGEGGWF